MWVKKLGSPVAVSTCPAHYAATGSAKAIRVLKAPNGCDCTCSCPKQPQDALGTINTVSIGDLLQPNPTNAALKLARKAAMNARSAVERARKHLNSAEKKGLVSPTAVKLLQEAQMYADEAVNKENEVAIAHQNQNQVIASQNADDADRAANQAVQKASLAIESLKYANRGKRRMQSILSA